MSGLKMEIYKADYRSFDQSDEIKDYEEGEEWEVEDEPVREVNIDEINKVEATSSRLPVVSTAENVSPLTETLPQRSKLVPDRDSSLTT